MQWTTWVFGPVAAAALMTGCGGDRRGNDAGTPGAGTETGTMRDNAGQTSDTAIPQSGDTAAATDTAQGGARIQRDTNNPATGADTANPGDTVRPTSDTATNPSQ